MDEIQSPSDHAGQLDLDLGPKPERNLGPNFGIELQDDLEGDTLREECGVFGIFGHPDAAAITALGLHALQHRGQEAAGIVSFDGARFHSERRLGLVGDTFSRREVIERLPGNSAVGHTRYSTTGGTILRNVQPLFAELNAGGFAVGHNGNLTNGLTLRRELVRNRLIESRLTPNAISLTGLALNLVAAVLVWERLFFLGGVAFIVGSIMDTLDGRYSRMSGKGTPFGAFLDSTLDRIEEGIVLTSVAGYFALTGKQVAAAAVVVAVLASLMVSYTRARAEALGVECKVGIATRPVRVVILSIGLVFARGASLGDFQLLEPAVYVLAVLSLVTVGQRIWHVRRELVGVT